jgi:hypothetical protein
MENLFVDQGYLGLLCGNVCPCSKCFLVMLVLIRAATCLLC